MRRMDTEYHLIPLAQGVWRSDESHVHWSKVSQVKKSLTTSNCSKNVVYDVKKW